MIKDLNKVFLEGTVVGNPVLVEANGKKALNFVLESMVDVEGQEKFYRHGCVMWDNAIAKFEDKVVNGTYLRVEGHLQAGVLNYIDGEDAKVLYYDKVNVKFLEG